MPADAAAGGVSTGIWESMSSINSLGLNFGAKCIMEQSCSYTPGNKLGPRLGSMQKVDNYRLGLTSTMFCKAQTIGTHGLLFAFWPLLKVNAGFAPNARFHRVHSMFALNSTSKIEKRPHKWEHLGSQTNLICWHQHFNISSSPL